MNRGYAGRRSADFAGLGRATLENLATMWKPLLAYVAGVAALVLVLPDVWAGLNGLLGLGLYLAAQYWLYRRLLKARGLLITQRIHALAFAGLAAMLIFPILFGIGLLVLPGVFLAARWIAAPAFVVARGDGPIMAAGASWQAVRGHTGAVMGVLVIAIIAVSLIGGALGSLLGGIGAAIALPGLDRTAQPFEVIEAQLIPLVMFALSAATYELLGPQDTMIEDVFG